MAVGFPLPLANHLSSCFFKETIMVPHYCLELSDMINIIDCHSKKVINVISLSIPYLISLPYHRGDAGYIYQAQQQSAMKNQRATANLMQGIFSFSYSNIYHLQTRLETSFHTLEIIARKYNKLHY